MTGKIEAHETRAGTTALANSVTSVAATTESSGVRGGLAVGARVRTGSAGDTQRWNETGVIVDDFGEILDPLHHYGRDWALTKRWAVALDNGALVFRHDNELDPEN
jgi:hypothetical protein